MVEGVEVVSRASSFNCATQFWEGCDETARSPIQPLPCLFARVMIGVLVIRRRSTLDIQISWTEHLCGDDKQQFLEKRLSTLEIFLSTCLSQAQQNGNTLLSLWWGRWQSKHPFDAIERLHINSPSPAETHSVLSYTEQSTEGSWKGMFLLGNIMGGQCQCVFKNPLHWGVVTHFSQRITGWALVFSHRGVSVVARPTSLGFGPRLPVSLE